MKPIPLLSVLLLAGTLALAQQPPPARHLMTAAELKKNFGLIEASTEGDETFEKLEATTVQGLVAYLKSHEVSASQAGDLGLGYIVSSDASHFKVFTYSFASGGQHYTAYKSVMQWQNTAGQRFAYALKEWLRVEKSYKLTSPGRTQYLLLGGQPGNSRCYNNQAYVMELKGNYLLLDNAAFGKKPSLELCNVELTFEPSRQVLRLDLSEDSDLMEGNDALAQMGWPSQPKAKRLKLQFSNGRFVKGG